MAYALPAFPIMCNIYTYGLYPTGPRVNCPCNLARGERSVIVLTGFSYSMMLLLPPLTDIRGILQSTGPDYVEVPAGSGRFYNVAFVDDTAKGFPNEHRFAILSQVAMPTPLT